MPSTTKSVNRSIVISGLKLRPRVYRMMLVRGLSAGAICLASLHGWCASAREVQVQVDGRSPPWDPRVNRKLAFGIGELRSPRTVFGARLFEGARIRFKASGWVAWIGGGKRVGPNGDPELILDRSYTYMPAHYVERPTRPGAVGGLVGAFVDADGVVIGSPFMIGEEATVRAPAGAVAISLGINDDLLSDNEGKFFVTVNIPEAQVIVESEPETGK